jgi:hypothetical protein
MATKKSGAKTVLSAKAGSGSGKPPKAPKPGKAGGRRKTTPPLNVTAATIETMALTNGQVSERLSGTCLFISLSGLTEAKASALATFLAQQGIAYFGVAGTLGGP